MKAEKALRETIQTRVVDLGICPSKNGGQSQAAGEKQQHKWAAAYYRLCTTAYQQASISYVCSEGVAWESRKRKFEAAINLVAALY